MNDSRATKKQKLDDESVRTEEDKEFSFKFGPYVPVLRPDNRIIINPLGIVDYYSEANSTESSKRLLGEILPDDAIVEAPSLVTPLLLKKKTQWPPRETAEQAQEWYDAKSDLNEAPQSPNTQNSGDDCEVVKVVSKDGAVQDDVEIIKDMSATADSYVRHKKTDDYVKATVIASLTNAKNLNKNKPPILTLKDFYSSSAAELMLGIGLSRVTEFNLQDKIRKLKSKIKRGVTTPEIFKSLDEANAEFNITRSSNKPFKSGKETKCNHCNFFSESMMVMEYHLEVPHMNRRDYLCNWCNFKTKNSSEIAFHNLVTHKKRCRFEKSLPIHCCYLCPYESNSKRKFTSHIAKCEQIFDPETVQAPTEFEDGDYPTITSKFITQADIKAYEAALKNFRLAAYNPHHIKVATHLNNGLIGQPILVLPGRVPQPIPNGSGQSAQGQLGTIAIGNLPLKAPFSFYARNNNQHTNKDSPQRQQNSPHLLHILAAQSATNSLNLAPNRSSILKHPRPQSNFANGMSVINNVQNIVMPPPPSLQKSNDTSLNESAASIRRPQDHQDSNESQQTGTFFICEICDEYLADRKQFKTHMRDSHKVIIHQRQPDSTRPPLNCQKCQYRFFTDQGLERHLLGSHGLITSNMQEQVDKETDAGRCTICGCKFAKKLVAHMKEFHKTALKPALLTYKCTACSATFNLYSHFENHVFNVHGDILRKQVAS